ncbi:MAG: hypothetical protein R6V56_04740 [Lentisphaeria bacterium]
MRSRVFHVLLFLTLLAVFALPLTVSSDGTAAGELKLTLTYSLSTVTVLLSLAAVLLGCIGLSREIETYQLHMVMTKPSPGWLVWSAKWFAIFSMNTAIFIFSAILIYGFTLGRFHYQDFPAQQKEEARNEILVGRYFYGPDKADFTALAQQRYKQMKQAGRFQPGHNAAGVIAELTRQIRAQSTEVPPQRPRTWRFSNLKMPASQSEISLRYRLYVASTQESKQRMTNGVWVIYNPAQEEGKRRPILRQRVMSGTFHEITIPAEYLTSADELFVQYANYDPAGKSVIFQPQDGPFLLVPVTGFTGNWLRACLVAILQLAVLTAVGCVAGAAFSAPVAVFVALASLFLGAVADPSIGEPARNATGEIVSWPLSNMLSHAVAVIMDTILVTVEGGQLARKLANGRLITFLSIGKVILLDVIIKGGILAGLGAWILSRRELGKVVRQ